MKIFRDRQMENTLERRREKRLRYNWPVWFAEDFNAVLSQGQMVDVSSGCKPEWKLRRNVYEPIILDKKG